MTLPPDDLASRARDPRDESIGDLVRRLVDDGKAYARAEVDLYKRIAKRRAGKAKTGAILLGVGIALLLSANTALILGIVLGLATLIGPFGAGLVAFALLAGLGGLLVLLGIKGLAALGGDDEEKAALARAENRP